MNKNSKKWLTLPSLFSAAVIGSLSLIGIQPAHSIFLDDPETVTQQDLGLAFAFFTLGGSPTATELIERANLLLPGVDLDIPDGSVLTPPEPTLENFKAFADGGTALTQQDLGVFFAAFTLLQGLPDPGSVELTSAELCARANLLLPGTDLDIPLDDFDKCVDPRTLGDDTTTTLELTLEGIPPRFDIDTGRPFVIPGDILKGTITASKSAESGGIEAGEITVSVVLNGTFDATPPRPLLTLSEARLNNGDVNCPALSTSCTGTAQVKISDLPEDLITRLQRGTLTVTVNGAGFGIRRTATASIDFKQSP